MEFTNHVSRQLHEEHRATVALMERLELLLARHRRGSAPPSGQPEVAQLLFDLATSLETEVQRHFDFEEKELFTYLTAMGDAAIGTHLTDEHAVIRPLGLRVAALGREAMARGFDDARWSEFRQLGQELSERLLAHVQKEEMALLPVLEGTMDADTDARLYEEYVATA
jgi:hemerythrin-like domain-containing protein